MVQTTPKIKEHKPLKNTSSRNYQWQGAKIKPTLGLLAMGLTLWFLPTPEGLTSQAWHLFALFATTIVAVIARPLPIGAISIIALALCIVTGTLTPAQSFSSFNSAIVWLIVFAFIIARGFLKTGLGERIAYFFISNFGSSTLGLSYSLVFTEFFLAPAVPSSTARGAGIIFPIVKSLAKEYGSSSEKGTSRKIAAYLVAVCFQTNLITSTMFLTAMASNPLIASLANDAGINIDWITWAQLTCVPGMMSLLLMPLFIYKIFPPQLKETREAPGKAREALKKKGSLKFGEFIMLGTFSLLIILWAIGGNFGITATTTALIGFAILLFTGVLDWQDVLNEKGAWETLIWFSVLLMMAGMLTELGMMGWLATKMSTVIQGYSWEVTVVVMALIYFYIHYFFAGVTAHVIALFGGFLVLMISSGVPPLVGAMTLAICSNLSGCLTHYGTGPAPAYYGAHFLRVREWWTIGFFMSLFYMAIWGGIGGLWWKVLGIW